MRNIEIVRAAVAAALCEHFNERRRYYEDNFATEAELANLLNDPIGNIDMLDYDTKTMVKRILAAGEEMTTRVG